MDSTATKGLEIKYKNETQSVVELVCSVIMLS